MHPFYFLALAKSKSFKISLCDEKLLQILILFLLNPQVPSFAKAIDPSGNPVTISIDRKERESNGMELD
jgi:hypothetical protein